jgi:5-methylcytosine-specific restriction endonuclease McrA
MSMVFEHFPALVLNADFRPLNYFPLSLWSWQEAIKAVISERVNVVSVYEKKIRSPNWEFSLPSVIALKEFMPVSRRPAFTRFNVFLRDRFICQYCGGHFLPQDLTFDHVVPRSRGGKTSWDNVVTACSPCNLTKKNYLTHEINMKPLSPATIPTHYQLQDHGRAFPPNYLHDSWRDFLYWDSELEN